MTADFGALRQLVARYQSRTTPTIVIGDQVVIGFDAERLDELLSK